MCKYVIYHPSNGYYSAVVSMRNIFYIIQVRDKPEDAYYRSLESFISTAELENCNAETHM